MTDLPHAFSDPALAEPAARLLTLAVESGGDRLDRFLALAVPAISRSRLKALIEAGAVLVNAAPCTDPSRKLKGGEQIVLDIPEPEAAEPLPENIPLEIAYEDKDLIVLDKPAGLVVHPAAGHATGTLVNALLAHCGETLSGIGGVRRPGIVHRLDKDTSGLMVVAKNDNAHQHLSAQFADHGRSGPLVRLYYAFVWGVPSRPHGTIEAAIDRSSVNREKMAVVAAGKGREAITHFAVEEIFNGADGKSLCSLIACRLETGRTHQIRVHMAHIGHPLLGDPVYGPGFKTKARLLAAPAQQALESLHRQALHAAELGFEHPASGETLHFDSPLPADLEALRTALRQG